MHKKTFTFNDGTIDLLFSKNNAEIEYIITDCSHKIVVQDKYTLNNLLSNKEIASAILNSQGFDASDLSSNGLQTE